MNGQPGPMQVSRCLLIGKQEKVFLPPFRSIPELFCCENILEGIQTAAHQPFEVVFVQLGCIEGMPIHALETLRQINPSSLIILLVQMIEEPLAVKLTRHSGQSTPADDYIVCPVRPDDLISFTQGILSKKGVTLEPVDPEKQNLENRIRELEVLVVQDDLTGLKNRRYLHQFLGQIVQLAEKKHLRITLLLFDIDNFKKYNDLYGHTIGDQVLRQAAELIQRCCRAHDVVARVGGDEFAVVFWDLPAGGESRKRKERRHTTANHPRQPLFMAERFRREISAAHLSFLGPHGKGVLTISGGLASYPEDARSAQHLYEQADCALLEAKRNGKNRLVLVGDMPTAKSAPQTADTTPSR